MDGIPGIAAQAQASAHSEALELDAARRAKGADAAKSFERILARTLVRELLRGLEGGFFQGAGSDVYGGWLEEHLGSSLADSGALGLAGMIKAGIGADDAGDGPGDTDEGAPSAPETHPDSERNLAEVSE